ncbi:MAG: DUF1844 domain-containing protein [Armatimonadota bacterium]|nr:DUF1844 domain-containing protein [Armatimonadota bacterium]
MSEEDKEYEIVDKRKVKINKDGDVEVVENANSKAQESAQPTEEEISATTQEAAVGEEQEPQLQPVDVYSLLKSFIGILGAHAWQWLGLVKDPLTGKIEKDLEQAKVAIDALALLIGHIENKLQPGELNELKGMLSDLRMNFVRQSGMG